MGLSKYHPKLDLEFIIYLTLDESSYYYTFLYF